MAYTASYLPATPQNVVAGDPATIVVTLTWDIGDTPPTATDAIFFDLAMPQPIPTGILRPATAGSNFPVRVGMIDSVDLAARVARFQAPFICEALGRVALNGSLESQPSDVFLNYEFNIV
ncbi:hypothetical protein [Pseudochrobactrum asaccharolyticum]|jgi:hypothetical protein|uniref:Uncharacterized protein n=1 Tax=Pseudochrobactrum asaccharolyticum TaxID=354351 RepID=A0A366DKL4_9HYPH|nr:hypothetical protein [Pseudochrobactrum asaccharolyticum]MBX8799707.1 hypothetical protein [Ochrobactrum sp. MR28]MBX8815543.1 hypothetical protein [Ochrobactrum sp. MR31]MDR2310986.1 hypothetical protein [Brucellaceae bacterium]RBO90576.1 hypothetical protein DFR47_11246 [Pseudochrobactrum asaccharolyticum]